MSDTTCVECKTRVPAYLRLCPACSDRATAHLPKSKLQQLTAERDELRALLETAADWIVDYGEHDSACPLKDVAMSVSDSPGLVEACECGGATILVQARAAIGRLRP